MRSNPAFSDRMALPPVPSRADCRCERGFSLIEVMITVFVLSLGLLGVGGLQYLAMKSNQSALSRAMATEYAYQMLDFIRSNPAVTADGADSVLTPDSTICSKANMCSPQSFGFTMGDSDSETQPTDMPAWVWSWVQNQWLSKLKNDLPGARASVCLSLSQDVKNGDLENCTGTGFGAWANNADSRYYVVTVRWEQAGTGTMFTQDDQQIVLVGEVQ